IAYRTLKGWLAQADFQQAYRAARYEILDRTVVQLLGACTNAVDTLKRNLTCGEFGPENRAAVAILEQTVRGIEVHDLAQQVAELKQQIEESGIGHRDTGSSGQSPPPSLAERDGDRQPEAGT